MRVDRIERGRDGKSFLVISFGDVMQEVCAAPVSGSMEENVSEHAGWFQTLSQNEKKLVRLAVQYAADPFPLTGSNDYRLIARLVEMLDSANVEVGVARTKVAGG